MNAINRRHFLALGGATALGAAAAGLSTPAEAAVPTSARIAVVTANIGRDHLDQRRPAIKAVHTWGANHVRPFVGWQEISEGDPDSAQHVEEGWIKNIFATGYSNAFLYTKAHREPLTVPSPWKIVDRQIHFGCSGLSGVTPTRYLTEVSVQHQANPALRFTMINTHYVAGAYNGKVDSYERQRVELWQTHFANHKKLVAARHNAGRLCVWTGDVNRHDMPAVHDKEKRVYTTGIDEIRWIPSYSSGVRLELLARATVDLHVDDHDARIAIFRISKI